MRRDSRRDFLKSAATAACTVGLAGAGISDISKALSTALQTVDAGTHPPTGATLAVKKGVLLEMLPEKLSYAERFILAKNVGFEVVQAPTTPNEQTAGEIKAAADRAGIRIDSVMNM